MPETTLQVIRKLIRTADYGMLSTNSVAEPGYPFSSLVAYMDEPKGNFIFLLSELAEHTKNLLVYPKASLLIADVSSNMDTGMDRPRVTMLGTVNKVVDGGDEIKEHYLQRHPKAALYVGFKDFSFYRMKVNKIRFVGGFGVAKWLSPDDI